MPAFEQQIDLGELGTLRLAWDLAGLRWEEPQRDCGWRGGWERDDVVLLSADLDGERLPKGVLLMPPFATHLPRWRAEAWEAWLALHGDDRDALADDSRWEAA